MGSKIQSVMIREDKHFKYLMQITYLEYKFQNKLTWAMPDPMSPPPTTVTVLMGRKAVAELEKLLLIPGNLFIFD